MRRWQRQFVGILGSVLLAGCGNGVVDEGNDIQMPPSAAEHVRMEKSLAGPPAFNLRWNIADGGGEVSSYRVYSGPERITEENKALYELTEVAGGTDLAQVSLLADTGIHYFRVGAINADQGVEVLSAEYEVDTTARLAIVTYDENGTITVNILSADGALSQPITSEQTVNQVIWAGTGMRIAFGSGPFLDVNLYTAEGQGTTFSSIAPVATNFSAALNHSWSPDGKRLAYCQADLDGDGFQEINITDIETDPLNPGSIIIGQTVSVGTEIAAHLRTMFWSPDGTRLAFHSLVLTGDEPGALYVASTKGGLSTKVSGDLRMSPFGPFSWSPDGSRLIFLAGVEFGNESLYLASLDGGEPVLIGDADLPGSAWSPDGSRLAFLTSGKLVTVDPDGGNQKLISEAGMDVRLFGWSPDSTRLALSVRLNSSKSVFHTVGSDGSGMTEVGLTSSFTTGFAWKPDSAFVAVRVSQDTESPRRDELYLITADGQDKERLTDETMDVGRFAWSADGEFIAIVLKKESEVDDLLVVPFTGGLPVEITGGAFNRITHIYWSPLSN